MKLYHNLFALVLQTFVRRNVSIFGDPSDSTLPAISMYYHDAAEWFARLFKIQSHCVLQESHGSSGLLVH